MVEHDLMTCPYTACSYIPITDEEQFNTINQVIHIIKVSEQLVSKHCHTGNTKAFTKLDQQHIGKLYSCKDTT